MKFILEIDLGESPCAKILAGQLHGIAADMWSATAPIEPRTWGISDPRTLRTSGYWQFREKGIDNNGIERCAQIASEFTMKPGRSIHPDIAWEEMSESARMIAHTTAQQIAQDILREIVEQPKAGKTLADFADSGKVFKRPMHANAYTFPAGSEHLEEITPNGTRYMPRLTREDLTATDWEEVTW